MIKLPVTWAVCGLVEVDKDTIPEAIEFFDNCIDSLSLPADGEYVESSFELTTREEEEIALYQER